MHTHANCHPDGDDDIHLHKNMHPDFYMHRISDCISNAKDSRYFTASRILTPCNSPPGTVGDA